MAVSPGPADASGAGYSGTPLATKLGVKDGYIVLLDRLPADLDLGLPPTATVVRRLRAGLDLTVTFHTRLATLTDRLPALFEHTVTHGMVWVAWPKQSAVKRLGIVTDLHENAVRELGLEIGWVDVKIAAIDDTWSGLKFVRRLVDR
jgi:hypothetical protein